MAKELIIQSSPDGADIALLEDRRLIELHHDSVEEDYLVGDIYLGRVRKVLPGLNAAFVDIGHEKDAFLHYLDLGPNIRSFNRYVELIKKGKYKDPRLQHFRLEPEILKTGKMDEVLAPNQPIVVQIVKEPISTKGPRLSSQVSLSGRYVILIPFNDQISLSKKIRSKTDRERLKKAVTNIKPKNFGVIIRTNAEGAPDADIEADLRKLLLDWEELVKTLGSNKMKLYSELDRTASLLRDLVNNSFSRIVVDSPKLQKQIKGYLQTINPGQEEMVKLYKAGDKTLFEQFDIDKQIRSLFNKIVNIGGGAYLIIEHTEAMHVIDVNSGSKRNRDDDQEENAVKTNLEAASEIARQLRLRDMGGIVVVDFIDMRSSANRKLVYERFKDIMKDDRAKHTVLPLTKFGIMQITRQRVRQEIIRDTSEPCPVCNGTGKVNKGVLITEDIRRKLETTLSHGKKSITLKVHPFVQAYFTKGLVSERLKWMMKYGRWVNIVADENFLLNHYEIE